MPGENVEHSFHIHAPEGVAFTSMKMTFPGPTPEGLAILTDQLEQTAAKYKGQHMDLLVFGCTAGSFIRGINWDQKCIVQMTKASGIPGLTTSTAVLEALTALGAKKVAVLTPYPEETNLAEKKFLEDNGFFVTNIVGMDMSGYRKIYCADQPFLYKNAKNMDMKGADVFFLSCMALDTLDFIQELEEDLGLPVITSHQATLWSALRNCRVCTIQPELGKLFTLRGTQNK